MGETSKTSRTTKSSRKVKVSKTQKTKYLTYIEDTPKHHNLLKDIVSKSGRKAVTKSISKDVAITYLEKGRIVKQSSDGRLRVLRKVNSTPRNVKVGSKTTLRKR